MNKNRLKKTASILLAGIMSFGVFAFAGPVFNVNADEEYTFDNISDWPSSENGKYQYAEIDGVEWCAISSSNMEDFGSALPSPKEEYGNLTHFVLINDETIALTNSLELKGGEAVTLNLRGGSIDVQTNGKPLLDLSGRANYSIINSSTQNSSIEAIGYSYINGGSQGGVFSVSSSNLRVDNVTISNRSASDKGGAIYAGTGSNVNLSNVVINSCNALFGGAIYVAENGTTVLNNVSFTNNGMITKKGTSLYCENGGKVALYGSISSSDSNSLAGDFWVNTGSQIQIGSTVNSFSIGCDDYTNPQYGYGVLQLVENGVSDGILCANPSYELVEQDSYLSFAEVSLTEEVTFKGMNAIVNDEVNGTYYPLAFKLTLSAPASFQSSEYSYDVGYSYIKKNGQKATAHNGNVSFTDDEAYLVIGMNPALLTNDITWKVEKDGESVFSGSVKPLNCLESYIEKGEVSTKTIAKDLIVMGVYTEEYLYNTSTLRAEAISQDLISEGDLDLSGVTLPSTGYTKDWNSSEDNLLTYFGCSLVLNEYGLAMRQYVYYGEGQGLSSMSDAISCTVNGVDYPSILNSSKNTSKSIFYYASVSNIKLSDLDKTNTFVFKYRIGQGAVFIDSGSIEYSVVDYMNMARNSKSTNTKLMNTLLSMYSLYNSCKAATQA